MHVACAIAGAWFFHKMPQWEAQLVLDVNEARAEKGMRPMIGTGYWIKYQCPDDDQQIVMPPSRKY